MHSTFFIAALAALPSTLAAPPRLPGAHFTLTKRCNDTAHNNTIPAAPPTCNLSKIIQPTNTLNPPDAMTLVMIAHGTGTQNYTCGANLTAPPSSIGAVAQLFDLSCAMAEQAEGPVIAKSKAAAIKSALETTESFGSITESPAVGQHFFVDNTTPDFDIIGLGNTQTKKVQDCNSPKPAEDIKWLRLEAQSSTSTSAVKMIYRLNTKGGMQPKTCEGRQVGEVMTVEYDAQYWIYEDPTVKASSSEEPQQQQPKQPAPLEVQTNAAVGVKSSASSIVLGLAGVYLYMFLW